MVETRSQEIERANVSLREYFEELRRNDLEMINRRFAEQKEAVQSAMQSAATAVSKAELASEKRQDAGNEIRQAMVDQQANFVTKPEFVGLERRTSILEGANNVAAGRAGGSASSGDLVFKVIAAISAILGAAGLLYGLTR